MPHERLKPRPFGRGDVTMAKIKKKGDDKKKPMTVEGAAARPRLDRPMRMKRADGGPTISKDSEDEAKRLKRSADDKAAPAGAGVLAGGVALGHLISRAALSGLGNRFGRADKIGTALSTSVLGGAGTKAYMDRDKIRESMAERKEADRIERGQAKPGEEDRRKSGGKVCK